MDSKIVHKSAFHKTNTLYLIIGAIFLYLLLYLNHGFLIYGSDTIETIPYALWMNDHSLFPEDFHLSHLRSSVFNERFISVYLLSLFGNQLEWGSKILHAIFTFLLCTGMIRFSDLILKHFSLSIMVVFITLIALYNINIGGNELYYNMYVPSLLAKSIAIWGLVFCYTRRYALASILLALATFFQPLVGLQVFVVLLPIVFFLNGFKKKSFIFLGIYAASAGVFIAYILGAQGPNVDSIYSFFEIVKFRIAHHFFPSYFPKSHIILLGFLYILSFLYYIRKNQFLGLFIGVSVLGIIVYLLGVSQQIETILSSQWMKINIWLKYFAVLGIVAALKDILEKKHLLFLTIGLFLISFSVSLYRFQPIYDKDYPTDLYAWIIVQTKSTDVLLVPPELNDFKARTTRSSYFDFKAMLHHRPAIYEWYKRFEQIYGMKPEDRTQEIDIFKEVKNRYLDGKDWNNLNVDYIIARQGQSVSNREIVFQGIDYVVYK